MCRGTQKNGERCSSGSDHDWCERHSEQQHFRVTCKALVIDGLPCTRKSRGEGDFCVAHSTSKHPACTGLRSFGERCKFKRVQGGGYCKKHQYQGQGDMCKGNKKDGNKCVGQASADGYCCWTHKPGVTCFVKPEQLRLSISRETRNAIAASCNNLDAYTNKPIVGRKNVDHVVEIQLLAFFLDTMWQSQRDHFGSDDKLDNAIYIVREGPVNAETNLRDTSERINMLKGEAFKQFIEVERNEDVVRTFSFTDQLQRANSSKFPGEKLDRATTGNIRRLVKAEAKNFMHHIADESDGDTLLDGVVAKFQEFVADIRKR
ncbi:hypothetical protein BBJ28_00005121 [Nothophytophthora sp. Chile5]|nr:hypothetical protein BBJ28_00005121 [Nothophytophthora sp. Chile5]